MQNYSNYPNSQNPQNPQFSNSRGGPAFTSPELHRPLQHNQVQANTILQNHYQLRAEGFASPLQGAGAPAYSFYQQDQGPFPAQPVRYLSGREMIEPTRYQAQTYASRPPVMELPSSYAESGISQQSLSLYERRVATQDSKQIFQLPPELFLLVTQPKIELKQGFFEVEGVNPRLKEIIEKNLIENNKRVLAEFFNDGNKQPQDITAQIDILSSSLQTQYDSLKNPPRSTGQVARSFSSPEHMRPNGPNEADAKANNYLKLRLNALIESLSQIESEQTYNEIKQCLSRLVEVNKEITLDQKHNDLLALSYQESRSSSPLSSPASLQQRENRGLAQSRLQELTRRIEELQTQNAEMQNLFTESQKSFVAENRKLKEANQQIEHLTQSKQEDELTIYQLTTKISSYDRNSARLHLIAQQEIEIESAKEKITELEFQKQELETQLSDVSQTNKVEKDQLEQRLQEKQTEIENQQKKIDDLGSLIALGKEGVESMNLEISEIQESLSKDIVEFKSDASKHLEATDRIISEGMLKQEDDSELIKTLQQQLSKITMEFDELKNSSNELDRTQTDIDSTNRRLKALLGESQREVSKLKKNLISASEIIKEKEDKLVESESLRKELTGESVVEKWLPASGPSGNELTTEDIERFTKWSGIDLTNEEIINRFLAQQNSTAQQSPTSEQETQTTDLPTQQLSQRVDAIAVAGAPSALYIAEVINDTKEQYLHKNTVSQQQASSSGPVEPQPDSSQQASSPSTSPRETQNSQSRLREEMQAGNDLMNL